MGAQTLSHPTKCVLLSGKHGRGARGATPASDAARRSDTQGMPRRAASCHVFFFFHDSRRLALTRLRLRPNRADLRQLGPYWAKPVKWLIQAKTADSGGWLQICNYTQKTPNIVQHKTYITATASLTSPYPNYPWPTITLTPPKNCKSDDQTQRIK